MTDQSRPIRQPNVAMLILGVIAHLTCLAGGAALIAIGLLLKDPVGPGPTLLIACGGACLLFGALLWRSHLGHLIAVCGALLLMVPATLLGLAPLVLAAGILAVATLVAPADEAIF